MSSPRKIAEAWVAEEFSSRDEPADVFTLARAFIVAEDRVQRLRVALSSIAETARWYADNSQRLPLEVDHALCVEVLSEAENALDEARDKEVTRDLLAIVARGEQRIRELEKIAMLVLEHEGWDGLPMQPSIYEKARAALA